MALTPTGLSAGACDFNSYTAYSYGRATQEMNALSFIISWLIGCRHGLLTDTISGARLKRDAASQPRVDT